MKKLTYLFLAFLPVGGVHAQDVLGLSTGNYGGIAGMTANPASIVDSRFKFDINLFGFSNYYTNNFVLLRRDALIKGDVFNNHYGDYDAFRKDILEINRLSGNEKVYARLNNRIQLPLSFMLTTGRKSAIALNITNRTNVMVDGLDPEFAQLAFDRFRNRALYNRDFNMDGVNIGLLNWVDVGFTYGRVIMDGDKHFLKAAATVKYIGGAASGYFKADQLNVRFSDSSVVNAQSPYIAYGHSEKVNEDVFAARNINALKNVSSTAGLDFGVVYEFRGRIERFKYLNAEYETRTRRDKNKYVLRLGASIMDVGRLRFNKGGYNNDFSANFNNYDVSGLSIRSAQDLDTALTPGATFRNGSGGYTVALPTAFNLQADLHVFKGFYLNASTYQPLKLLQADQRMDVTPAYAITPRFESRVFGFYVPVTYNKLDNWNVGATLRLGPLYVGSSNLGSLIVNEKTRTADVHAGMHIPIAFGKKTRVAHLFDRIVQGDQVTNNSTNTTIHNGDKDEEIRILRERIRELERRPAGMQPTLERAPGQPIYITVNNYGTGVHTTVHIDSLQPAAVPVPNDTMVHHQQFMPSVDSDENSVEQQGELDFLKRQMNGKEQQLRNLELRLQEIEDRSRKQRAPASGYRNNAPIIVPVARSSANTDAQIAALRRELQNYERQKSKDERVQERVIVVPQVAAAPPPAQIKVVHDTVVRYVADTMKQEPDTVFVQADTVRITNTIEKIVKQETVTDNTSKKLLAMRLETVHFEVGKSNIKPSYFKGLNFAARQLLEYPELKIKLTGHTDKTGQPAANQRLSEARANAVKNYLAGKGVATDRMLVEYFGAEDPAEENDTHTGKLMNRRVELAFYE